MCGICVRAPANLWIRLHNICFYAERESAMQRNQNTTFITNETCDCILSIYYSINHESQARAIYCDNGWKCEKIMKTVAVALKKSVFSAHTHTSLSSPYTMNYGHRSNVQHKSTTQTDPVQFAIYIHITLLSIIIIIIIIGTMCDWWDGKNSFLLIWVYDWRMHSCICNTIHSNYYYCIQYNVRIK